MVLFFFFFFSSRRRHTRYWRDWSSDVCSSDLLLGLIREGEGVAAQVLVKLGADLNRVRQQVLQLLSGYQGKEPAESGSGRGEGTPSSSLVLDQFGRNLTASAREGKLDRKSVV